MSGMPSLTDGAAHGLFGGVRKRPGAERAGAAHDPATQRAKRAGERLLLLSLRGIVGGSGSGGVVFVAVAISDLFYGRMRGGSGDGRSLVWAECAKGGLVTELEQVDSSCLVWRG